MIFLKDVLILHHILFQPFISLVHSFFCSTDFLFSRKKPKMMQSPSRAVTWAMPHVRRYHPRHQAHRGTLHESCQGLFRSLALGI